MGLKRIDKLYFMVYNTLCSSFKLYFFIFWRGVMTEEKTEKLTLYGPDGSGGLSWEVPSNVQEEIDRLKPEEREQYVRELSRALIQVARTLAVLASNRKRYYLYVRDFFRILGNIRTAYADADPEPKPEPRPYSFEA
jgi:hypothetical protein